MRYRPLLLALLASTACGEDDVDVPNPLTNPSDGPAAGTSAAACGVPASAGLEDSSAPRTVIGDGSAASCTSAAVVDAVAKGGVITFNCGAEPVTITLERTAKVVNDTGPKIVIDGGGLVTLSGAGRRRILYMNTCDRAQKWTTSHCDNQDHPQLTLQNITFIDGNSTSDDEQEEGVDGGGGAVWASGGRLKVVNARFFGNHTIANGPEVGGGAIRAYQQFDNQPVTIVNTTFGGAEGFGNAGSNGGAISSIGVSWRIINSVFSYNEALGNDDGGAGGAIYNDGGRMTLDICGSELTHNEARTFGSAIFFVTNDHTGDIKIDKSTITNNVGGSWYPTYPQISGHDDTPIRVSESTIR